MVNISSFYDGCDETCLLDKGDHPFIRHLSYVFYAWAIIIRADQIERGIARKILIPQPDIGEEVFRRIEAGIAISPETPRNVLKYLYQLK